MWTFPFGPSSKKDSYADANVSPEKSLVFSLVTKTQYYKLEEKQG